MVVVRADHDPLVGEPALAAQDAADVVGHRVAAVDLDREAHEDAVLAEHRARRRILGSRVGERAQRGEVASLGVGGLDQRVGRGAVGEEARDPELAAEAVGAHAEEIRLLARGTRGLGDHDRDRIADIAQAIAGEGRARDLTHRRALAIAPDRARGAPPARLTPRTCRFDAAKRTVAPHAIALIAAEILLTNQESF